MICSGTGRPPGTRRCPASWKTSGVQVTLQRAASRVDSKADPVQALKLVFHDESLGDHVVKGLLFCRERGNNESDAEQKYRNVFREMSPGCARE